VLVDAGTSRREIVTRLAAIGESPEALDAVLITHEHGDHVCGLIPLLRKYGMPVYMSRLTAPTIAWGDFEPRLESFMAGERFRIGDLDVVNVSTSRSPMPSIRSASALPAAGRGWGLLPIWATCPIR
jgi:phosphoribosyl 1,2-cyclic phosphodiesterase